MEVPRVDSIRRILVVRMVLDSSHSRLVVLAESDGKGECVGVLMVLVFGVVWIFWLSPPSMLPF